jgi:hypothetical protein
MWIYPEGVCCFTPDSEDIKSKMGPIYELKYQNW